MTTEDAAYDFYRREHLTLVKWKSEAEQTIAMLKDEIQTLRHEARKMREELDCDKPIHTEKELQQYRLMSPVRK
ncbi:MAG TPA: hypothetical protein VFG51_01920 [Candidatus Saccharimonadia bacterium]|nr:hypothetical protein [Candidatus Saccharimonadia bacterium]